MDSMCLCLDYMGDEAGGSEGRYCTMLDVGMDGISTRVDFYFYYSTL